MTLLAEDPAAATRALRSPDAGQRELGARIPIWHGLAALPDDRGRCVAALGVFDGIHRGHARLLSHAVELGREQALPVVLVTFDPHPARVLGIPRDTSTLSSLSQQAVWAGELGVDGVAVLPFTTALAALSPAEFTGTVLARALQVEAVVVGANFTFGARAAGDATTLVELGARHGFSAHPLDLLPIAGATCSSTSIRLCLQRGDVAGAAAALGRPHQVDARASRGEPNVDEHTALPAPGHYDTRITIEKATGRRSVVAESRGWVTVDETRRLHLDDPLRCRDGSRVLVSFIERSA